MNVLKVLGLIVVALVGLVALGVVLTTLAVARVRSEVRETHASFRVGQSPFEFRIPDSVQRVSIRFSSAGEPRKDCGTALTNRGDSLLLIRETIDRKELPHRSQLAGIFRAQHWDVDHCTHMYVTISSWLIGWPYRGTVKVHYEKGVVTKVEKPFFWE